MFETKDLDAIRSDGAIFLDDGGVMNDNRLRAPEWFRLIAEFMPPRLGATGEEWSYHNQIVIRGVLEDIFRRLPDFPNHREFQRAYATNWMTEMCEAVGVPMPSDPEALYRELSVYVAERANAELDGAVEAVRALDRAGYRVFTASGTASWELRGIVTRMGIAGAFKTLYGPDLVDHVKYGAVYYEKVFAHAGVDPGLALVVDSDLLCCEWAREAGAKAVWVDHDGHGEMPSLAVLVDAMLNS